MSTINKEDALDAVYERIRQIGYEHNASVLSIRQAIRDLPSTQSELAKMIKEIRKWIDSGNRGNADYFIVDKIEEIIDKYE